MKRFALRGESAFVVFKDIKISLAFFGSFLGYAKKNESFNLTDLILKRRDKEKKLI